MDVLAYVIGLMGVTFVVDNAIEILIHGVTTYAAGMGVIGLFALAAAAAVYRDPSNIRNGTEAAPAYLYVLPLVSTGAAAMLATSWVLRLL